MSSSNLNQDWISYYESELSTRSLNIIKELGGRDELLNYFKIHGTFFGLRKVGKATEVELVNLCKYIISQNPNYEDLSNDAEKVNSESMIKSNFYFSLDTQVLPVFERQYVFQKSMLSISSIKFLDNLERSIGFGAPEKKKYYFEKYFLNNFDFATILKSENKRYKQIMQLRRNLINQFNLAIYSSDRFDAFNILPTDIAVQEVFNIASEALPVDIALEVVDFDPDIYMPNGKDIASLSLKYQVESLSEENKLRVLLTVVSKLFKQEFDKNSCPDLFLDSTIKVEVLFYLLINETKMKQAKQSVVKICYFSNSEFTYREIADQINCTAELVRLHINWFEKSFLPSLVNKVKRSIVIRFLDLFDFDKYWIMWVDSVDCFAHYEDQIVVNLSFKKLLYKNLYNEYALDLVESLNNTKFKFRALDFSSLIIFVNRNYYEEYSLLELIKFLDTEVFNFVIADFDFNMEVLIARFYQERDLNGLSKDEIVVFSNHLSRVIKADSIRSSSLKRTFEKREFKEKIKQLIEDFLLNSNFPLKTNDILDYLRENHIDIGKGELLRLLGMYRSVFVRCGTGLWGIKSRHTSNGLSGSLREIVEDLLLKSEHPLHISELCDEIQLIRPISVHSLFTNLRSVDYDCFVFFNCSYIGLGSKKYSEYWYNLPAVNGRHFTLIAHKMDAQENVDRFVKHMNEKHGYPELHIRYLLKERLKQHQ